MNSRIALVRCFENVNKSTLNIPLKDTPPAVFNPVDPSSGQSHGHNIDLLKKIEPQCICLKT